jgi:3-hydroxyacyl-CoA dehydrogenase
MIEYTDNSEIGRKLSLIKKVAVIGSGTMGHSIAQVFAAAQCPVTIYDLREDLLTKARQMIIQNLEVMKKESYINSEEQNKTLEMLSYSTDLGEAVHDADLIIEAIPEVLEFKLQLFKLLETRIRSTAIVASNTSTFPISKLAEECAFSERLLITHFFNPAHLVKLVEVVKHEHTVPWAAEEVIHLLKAAGKKAVLLNKDIPGFIANRLQAAVVREAFYLLEEGIANADDIDKVMSEGPGMRWALNGPLRIADMGGLDILEKVTGNLFPELDCSTEAPRFIVESVKQGNLGSKTGKGIYVYSGTGDGSLDIRDKQLIHLLKM